MTSLSNVKKKRLYVDPRTTCLPPLNETIPTSGKRTVLACPTLKKAPFGICLCGAHDIMGRGSDVQELPHLDPFSMIHFVESQHRLKPPFCAHPHLGAEVCSIMLRGEEIVPCRFNLFLDPNTAVCNIWTRTDFSFFFLVFLLIIDIYI